MRALRSFATPICLILLSVGFALTGLSAALRLIVLNPKYYISALPRIRYCEQMQDYINEDLDHVGALYGFSDGALSDLVTTHEIKAYTQVYLAAVFAYDGGDFHVEPFSTTAFADFFSKNTDHGYDAAVEFSEDCLAEAQACMTASAQDLLLNGLQATLQNRYVLLVSKATVPLLAIDVALLLLLLMSYLGQMRLGAVFASGALFLGASLLFAPTVVFAARGYIGRLNIAASALQLQVTGVVNAALTALLTAFGALLVVAAVLLVLFVLLYVKKTRKRRKKTLTDA